MSKLPKTTVALIVSMIANAFLVGYIASSLVTRPPLPPRPMPFDRMESALSHVSPQYQDDIQNLIDEHKSEFERRIKGMRSNFDKIQTLLTAPTFDADALRAIQQDLEKQDDPKSDMLSLLISIGQTLPDEERIKFFEESAPDRPPFGGPRP